MDEAHNPFLGDEADPLLKKREEAMQKRLQRRDGSMMTLAQSKRANELQKDMNAWEENRLMTSGGGWQSWQCWRLAVLAVASAVLLVWQWASSRVQQAGGAHHHTTSLRWRRLLARPDLPTSFPSFPIPSPPSHLPPTCRRGAHA